MSTPPISPTSAKAEPKTQLGQFYRAHRPEVLGGIGFVVAAFAYYKSKHPSSSSTASSSTAATTSIDPSTGYPAGSAADEAALAQQAAGTAISSVPTSGDGSTSGYADGGGTGYSGGGGGISTIETDLAGIQSSISALSLTQTTPPGTTSVTPPSVTTTPPSPVVTPTPPPTTPAAPTATQTANLKNLNRELTKDEAGSTAGDKASVTTLKKQIAAVTARS